LATTETWEFRDMTKTMHSTTSRRQTPAGTAGRQPAVTENAPASASFVDPTTLPDEYATRVRGDCLAPAIESGDSVLVDKRQPYAAGDLVCGSSSPNDPGAARTSA
jgi:phage repressor protein C with HTH and peptisase S24 domain